MITLMQLLRAGMVAQGEDLGNLIGITSKPDELDVPFDNRKGCRRPNSKFTAWSHRRVYFPVDSNGELWVDSVPRLASSGESTAPKCYVFEETP